MRKLLGLGLALFLAGCAASAPPPMAAPPPPAPAPAPVPRVEPPNFTALSPEALRARLGAPAFSRKDGATDMWRYDSKSCRAFFFFTGNQITHVETMPEGPGNNADVACLNSLKKPS